MVGGVLGTSVTASPLGRGDSVALYDVKYADKTEESFLASEAAGGSALSPRTGGATAVLLPPPGVRGQHWRFATTFT